MTGSCDIAPWAGQSSPTNQQQLTSPPMERSPKLQDTIIHGPVLVILESTQNFGVNVLEHGYGVLISAPPHELDVQALARDMLSSKCRGVLTISELLQMHFKISSTGTRLE